MITKLSLTRGSARRCLAALAFGVVVLAGGLAHAQQAGAGKKDESAPQQAKFKFELVEQDPGSPQAVDVKVKDKDGKDIDPNADNSPIPEDKKYGTVKLEITRYQGSDCTRVCKVLSNGTTQCYRVCN